MNSERPEPNSTPRSLGIEAMGKDSFLKSKSRRCDKSFESDTKACRPRDTDVLCGRGRGYFEHPGNRRMLAIISRFKCEYQTASKTDKSIITNRVLHLILNPRDGTARPRFLKESHGSKKEKGVNGSWSELCEKEIHKKVAHTLREQKTILKMGNVAISDCIMHQLNETMCTPLSSFVDEQESCSYQEEPKNQGVPRQVSELSMPKSVVLPTTDLARFVSSDTQDMGMVASQPSKLADSCRIVASTEPVPKTSRFLVHHMGFDASTFDAIPISDDEDVTSRQYKDNGEGSWFQEPARPGVMGTITPPNEPDEPLSLEQEPIFDEGDLNNLLTNVLDDAESEDNDSSFLDSYLDCLALASWPSNKINKKASQVAL